jgi:hypothetical protein
MNKKVIYILLTLLILSSLAIYFLFINKKDSLDLPPEQNSDQRQEERSKMSNEETDSFCSSIGDSCEGGILAHIDEDGNKLIVSNVDNGEDIQWGCRGQLLNITSKEYGSGENNTESLVNWHKGWEDPWYIAPTETSGYCHEKNDGSVAAKVCYDLELNDFTDWFLPSIEELNLIYENVHKNFQGDFGRNEYWSSSEYTEGSSWIKSFLNGDEYGYQKSFNRMVRCVRTI